MTPYRSCTLDGDLPRLFLPVTGFCRVESDQKKRLIAIILWVSALKSGWHPYVHRPGTGGTISMFDFDVAVWCRASGCRPIQRMNTRCHVRQRILSVVSRYISVTLSQSQLMCDYRPVYDGVTVSSICSLISRD